MKICFSLLTVLFAAFTLDAQIPAGSWFAGGAVDFNYSNPRGFTSTDVETKDRGLSFSLSPLAGYALTPRLALGARLTYSHVSNRSVSELGAGTRESTQRQNGYLFSPFVRFIRPVSDRFGVMLQAGAGVAFSNSTFEEEIGIGNIRNVTRGTGFDINAAAQPLLYYFLSPRFGLEASLGALYFNYESRKPEDGARAYRTYSGFSFASALNLGFSYYFGVERE